MIVLYKMIGFYHHFQFISVGLCLNGLLPYQVYISALVCQWGLGCLPYITCHYEKDNYLWPKMRLA